MIRFLVAPVTKEHFAALLEHEPKLPGGKPALSAKPLVWCPLLWLDGTDPWYWPTSDVVPTVEEEPERDPLSPPNYRAFIEI